MVDEIPKISPELFQLGNVEKVNKVVPKPEERKRRSSEPDDEGVLQERAAMGKKKRPVPEEPPVKGAKPEVAEGEEKKEGDKHIDVVA